MTKFKIICSIFMQNIQDARLLKRLLLKYKMVKVEGIIQNPAAVTEHFHDVCPNLLFIDFDKVNILKHVPKPQFIIAVGHKTNAIQMRKYLANGIFDFLFLPISEESITILMIKMFNIMSIHSHFLIESFPTASDNNVTYNGMEISQPLPQSGLNYNYFYVFAGQDSQLIKLVYNEILFISKVGNHICIHLEKGDKQYVKTTLKYFQERLPSTIFLKISQSTVINIEKISKIEKPNKIIIGDEVLLVARSFKKQLKQRIYR